MTTNEMFRLLFDSMNEMEDKEVLEQDQKKLSALLNLSYEDIEKFFTDREFHDNFKYDESKRSTVDGIMMFGCFVINSYLLGYQQGRETFAKEIIDLSIEDAKESEPKE